METGSVVGEFALPSHTFVIGQVAAMMTHDIGAEPMPIARNPLALAFSAPASSGDLGTV